MPGARSGPSANRVPNQILDQVAWLAACAASGDYDDGAAADAAQLLSEEAGELARDTLTVARWLAHDGVNGAWRIGEPARRRAIYHIDTFAQTIADRL